MLAQRGARVAAPALAIVTRQEGKGGMMRGRGKRAKANSSHFQCSFRGAQAAGCTPATSTRHCTGGHGVLCGTHGCVGTACAQLAGLLLPFFFFATGKQRQGNIFPAVIRALRGHLGRWRHSQISGRCATEPPLQQCLGRRSRRQHLSGPGRARC